MPEGEKNWGCQNLHLLVGIGLTDLPNIVPPCLPLSGITVVRFIPTGIILC